MYPVLLHLGDFALPAYGTALALAFAIGTAFAALRAPRLGLDRELVVGGWERSLSHGSDTINLRDALGNLVDHVKYGDGKPLNDQEPKDGTDDGTFLGSEWPTGADGTGRTIELIHPRLDNRNGAAWTVGPVDGTPGADNAGLDASPPAVVAGVGHSLGHGEFTARSMKRLDKARLHVRDEIQGLALGDSLLTDLGVLALYEEERL